MSSIISKEDKDSFIDFIEQVNNTNKEYDKIQTLSNTLVNAHDQLKDKNNKIKTLTENNNALNLRVKTLNETIKENSLASNELRIIDDVNDVSNLEFNLQKSPSASSFTLLVNGINLS